ncbi:MAG: transglycosylase SLT domain-containing protein [Candidatus Wallbacteria bacterium]|nr:transglycosylase SLT domain-containing protein [Candidatus Wallbacteria bacterium]
MSFLQRFPTPELRCRTLVLFAAVLVGSWGRSPAETPTFEDLSTVESTPAAPSTGDPIVTRADGRYYRYDGRELFGDIARKAYGDPSLWLLIYKQNVSRLAPGSTAGTEGEGLLLKLPEPPEKRVFTEDGRRKIRVIPGDSLLTIAKRVYGASKYWPALYLANKSRLPDPENPFRVFAAGSRETKIFDLPSQSEAEGMSATAHQEFGSASSPSAPTSTADLGGSDRSSGPGAPVSSERSLGSKLAGEEGRLKGSAAADQSAAVTGAFRKTANPIASLDLKDASQIGLDQAKTILEGTGMLKAGEPLSLGLKRLHKGYTYKSGGGVLDAAAKQRLFREYTLLRASLDRWAAYPDIGSKSTPKLVDEWVKKAGAKLTALPEGQREKLIRSLLMQESSVRHWRNFRPVVGQAADTGFGQFLPATARQFGINPYDPEQNILGVALFLNRLVRQKRGNVREALASYNGGSRPPPVSYRYADSILARAR